MPKFEKQYVHFMWDDELEGKKGFFSDDIVTLRTDVSDNNRRWYGVAYSGAEAPYQFKCGGEGYSFHFFYHDPHYDLKVAREQGKKIEYKRKGKAWEDWTYTPAPAWLDDNEYRIMPEEEKPITNRELAHWLAQGNGEYTEKGLRDTSINCYANFNYSSLFQDDPIPDSFLIRKWDDDEWRTPTREYMGLEEWW